MVYYALTQPAALAQGGKKSQFCSRVSQLMALHRNFYLSSPKFHVSPAVHLMILEKVLSRVY